MKIVKDLEEEFLKVLSDNLNKKISKFSQKNGINL